MAKGKQREASVEESSGEPSPPENQEVVSTPDPLAAEVEAFLNQRTALAARITEEIAATETRLAELRKTLAMLLPDSAESSGGKDRKPKKAKPKESPRTSQPVPASPEALE